MNKNLVKLQNIKNEVILCTHSYKDIEFSENHFFYLLKFSMPLNLIDFNLYSFFFKFCFGFEIMLYILYCL